MNFRKKLAQAVQRNNSTLCVGLDPNLQLLPEGIKKDGQTDVEKVRQFLKIVVDTTHEYCAAYKPNIGFFEALGPAGWDLFADMLDYLPSDKIIIADAKRGDISSTAQHYAKAFFEKFEIDAITLNPLMGFETLEPFLEYSDKGIYTLTLTSNPGATDILLQELAQGKTVANHIAQKLAQKQLNHEAAIGMVVGATKAPDLGPVIKHFPASPLLIPGVGKQGGSIKELASALKNHEGIPLINSSRSIIYAGSDAPDWDQAIAHSAENLQQRLAPITQLYV